MKAFIPTGVPSHGPSWLQEAHKKQNETLEFGPPFGPPYWDGFRAMLAPCWDRFRSNNAWEPHLVN